MNYTFMKKKHLIGLAIMVIAAIIGLIGSNVMMLSEQNTADQYLQLACDAATKTADEELIVIEESVDMMVARISQEIQSYDAFLDLDNRNTALLKMQLQGEYLLRMHPIACTSYFRFNPQVTQNEAEGYFISIDGEDKVVELPLTDLSEYEEEDLSVNWYYLPIKFGDGVWLDPYDDATLEKNIISYSVPMYVDEKLIGVAGMDLAVQTLLERANNLDVVESAIYVVTDRSDTLLDGETLPNNISDYVSATGKLCNDMKLTVYIPKKEVYQIRYGVSYYAVVISCVLLLITSIMLLIYTINTNSGKKNEQSVTRGHIVPVVFSLVAVITLAAQGLFLGIGGGFFAGNQRNTVTKPADYFDRTIRVVADEKYAPYSSLDEEGNPTGYDVAVIYELGKAMQSNIELELLPWEKCVERMQSKEADVILGLELLSAQNDDFLRTEGVGTDAIRIYGKASVGSISEIIGSRIGTIVDNGLLDVYGIFGNAILYASFEDAFLGLESGMVDYVVAGENTANIIIRNHDFKDILVVYDLMESQNCYGVSKDNAKLLAELNDAIIMLRDNDKLADMNDAWLQKPGEETAFDFVRRHLIFYALTMSLTIICLIGAVSGFLMNQNTKKWIRFSDTDALTGINNRGGGERKIRELIHHQIPGMFCLFDVDKFKSINDTFGHSTGDQVLMAIAEGMELAFREKDILMRLGGDEFAVYVPNVTDEETGTKVIERFFEEIHLIHLEDLKGREICISLGASFYRCDNDDDFAAVYRRADQGAYRSKKVVGNRYNFVRKETV